MVVLVHRPAFYHGSRVRKKDLGTKGTMTEKNISWKVGILQREEEKA